MKLLKITLLLSLMLSPALAQNSIKCVGCERDKAGNIKRSEASKKAFRKTHPCPSTGKTHGACPGYDIDHITPLYQGGEDKPGNMQWLSDAQHKAKHSTLPPSSSAVHSTPATSTHPSSSATRKRDDLSNSPVYTGPRGGKYKINSSGRKVYQRRK